MATVLVVDDRAVNREVTRATLQLSGHRVIEAARASEALSLVRSHPPDVVVADVLMPGMDGYELVRRLRTTADTSLIPVLLYTANYSPAEAAPLARACGAARLLVKSGDPDELLAAVEEALHGELPPLEPAAPDATAQQLHTLNAKLVDKVRELEASQHQLCAREEQDRHRLAEKLDSLVRMSGGVAHDFNNLLNVMLSFAEFAAEGVREAADAPLSAEQAAGIVRDLEQISRAGKRAAHLTHQLLVFGGRDLVKPTVVDPNRTVAEVCGLLASTVGRHVTIETELAPDLHRVVVDDDQLCQVLINLALNARDAMPHGGRLLFRTVNVREMPAAAYPVQEPAALRFVEITVTDDGEGMPEDVQRRAIEPFFTTKPRGTGSGLGLATAFGTLRQAGGHLVIESALGVGTTIRLFLPATEEPVDATVAAPRPPRAAGQTILVAEDEDGVRAVAERVLSSAGYRVLTAVNGADALAVARRHGPGLDAVLSDVVMPRLDGPSFVRDLRATHPDVPVLYMSGYAAPLMSGHGAIEPDVTILSKPFTSAELLGAIQALLAAHRPR